MDVTQVRRDFPGVHDKTFLNAAGLSIPPAPAVRAVESYLMQSLLRPHPDTPMASTSQYHETLEHGKETARSEVATLLNCSPTEIAFAESTTHGLNVAVSCIPFERDDNVIVCDLEFIQVVLPFLNLRETIGIEVRVVEHTGGQVTVDQFAAAIDERTKAICVSSVQWVHGLCLDLAGLSELAQQHDLYLIVDGIQQAGAIGLDLSELRIDFLACGGHKWLNAPFGSGFLYVRKETQAKCEPQMRGYLTLEAPENGWGSFFADPAATPFITPTYVENARAFEIGGSSNYPGIIGLGASIGYVNTLGIKNTQAHIFTLTDYLVDGLRRRDARIVSPLDEASRSGIITFRLFSDPRADDHLVQQLLHNERVYVATRYTAGIGGTRVSVHYFNTHEDIETLLDAIDRIVHRMRS